MGSGDDVVELWHNIWETTGGNHSVLLERVRLGNGDDHQWLDINERAKAWPSVEQTMEIVTNGLKTTLMKELL